MAESAYELRGLLELRGQALRIKRTRAPMDASPAQVLRHWRGRPRLVALAGRWHDGQTIITWDPVAALAADDDPFEVLS